MKKLKIGIIGSSIGNGHPYSWSAIFNGYDQEKMWECEFPVISTYLAEQKFPDDFLTDLAQVTHVWTQDPDLSQKIAQASRIRTVSLSLNEMAGEVDGVLLARDDAETHPEIVEPFLKAGVPVFIDKPFALSMKDARWMLEQQLYDEQVFTCSALRYAEELILSHSDHEQIGAIQHVNGTIMKKWETYGIHLLEPIIVNLPDRGRLLAVESVWDKEIHTVEVKWEHCSATLKITGSHPSDLALIYSGEKGQVKKKFVDSFSCFKKSLETFVKQAQTQHQLIPRKDTLELVDILERGFC